MRKRKKTGYKYNYRVDPKGNRCKRCDILLEAVVYLMQKGVRDGYCHFCVKEQRYELGELNVKESKETSPHQRWESDD